MKRSLFLSDVFPTGYMAAENAEIEEGDTVAVWGCGPVGQFALKSARWFGADNLIAIDDVPERLEMAKRESGAETINFEEENVYDRLMELTQGIGPDRCIDAVGCEAFAGGIPDGMIDAVKTADNALDRQSSCITSGDLGLPQRWDDLDAGCLCWFCR